MPFDLCEGRDFEVLRFTKTLSKKALSLTRSFHSLEITEGTEKILNQRRLSARFLPKGAVSADFLPHLLRVLINFSTSGSMEAGSSSICFLRLSTLFMMLSFEKPEEGRHLLMRVPVPLRSVIYALSNASLQPPKGDALYRTPGGDIPRNVTFCIFRTCAQPLR